MKAFVNFLIYTCIGLLYLTAISVGCSAIEPAPAAGEPAVVDDATVFHHNGCEYLKFEDYHRWEQTAIHSETCPNHPLRLQGITTFPGGYERFDYGWNLKEGNYTFICPNGAKVVFYDRDIVRDSTIGDGDEFVTVTEDGMTLHVPANL